MLKVSEIYRWLAEPTELYVSCEDSDEAGFSFNCYKIKDDGLKKLEFVVKDSLKDLGLFDTFLVLALFPANEPPMFHYYYAKILIFGSDEIFYILFDERTEDVETIASSVLPLNFNE